MYEPTLAERGYVYTNAEAYKGEWHGKQFQEQVINRLIDCVYVSDGRTAIYFNFDNNEKPFISITDNNDATAEAIEKSEALNASSNAFDAGRDGGIRSEA